MARRLGTILVDMGYLDEESLWKVLEEQKRSGSELLGKVAVRMGLVKEDQVLKALGEQLGMKVVKLADVDDPGRADRAGQRDAWRRRSRSCRSRRTRRTRALTVAMAEPQNPATLDSLQSFLGVEVKGVIATESDVLAAIERLYAGHAEIDPGRGQADREGQGPRRSSPAATRTRSTWRPSRRWPRRRRCGSC